VLSRLFNPQTGTTEGAETPVAARPQRPTESEKPVAETAKPRPARSEPPRAEARPATAAAEAVSVLGPSVRFRGELTADEDLLIQGEVAGTVRHTARNLTIGARGKVHADIYGNYVLVQGEVRGDLFATQAVIVETTGTVRGSIVAPRVALKDGASFKGRIEMEPSGQPAPQQAPGIATAAPALPETAVDALLK
jgi:cytoskeletal protein CcmA (bactofilin family)